MGLPRSYSPQKESGGRRKQSGRRRGSGVPAQRCEQSFIPARQAALLQETAEGGRSGRVGKPSNDTGDVAGSERNEQSGVTAAQENPEARSRGS